MGIRNLQTFVENDCPGAFYDVDIGELARAAVYQGIEPVIIVDAYNIVGHLYRQLDWVSGGQFREFTEHLAQFIQGFSSLGIKLIFVGDGSCQTDKRDEWIKRRYERLEKIVYPVYDALKRAQFPDFLEGLIPMVLITTQLKYIFHQDVRTSLREADEEISELARDHRAIGILAQDSDYLIYRSNTTYLSMNELNWVTMKTKAYDPRQLAHTLNIQDSQLPLLALLAGNDVVNAQRLHRNTRGKNRFWPICDFIRDNGFSQDFKGQLDDLKWVARDVFQDESLIPLLQRSLRQYWLRTVDIQLSRSSSQRDANWDEIIELFRADYISNISPKMFPVMIGKPYESCTAMEDYRESYLIPPAGLLWESTRQRVYGILLKEKPGAVVDNEFVIKVDEWVMNGPQTIDSVCQVSPVMPDQHPGLLTLHTRHTDAVQEERLRLLAWCVDPRLDPQLLTDLTPGEICLLTNLYKMQWERESPVLEDWEVRVFILQFYCLEEWTGRDRRGLTRVLPNPRGLHLATLYTRSFMPNIVDAVGRPFSLGHTLLNDQLDGKLFQNVYNQAAFSADWRAGRMRPLIGQFIVQNIAETENKIFKIRERIQR